jgi:hypothetical protein
VRAYEASSVIEAKPEAVWEVLSDGAGWSTWDSGVVRVEGSLAPGQKIKVVSEVNPGKAFPVTVTGFTPAESMTFTGGTPLFRGVRRYTLAAQDDGTTRFTMREEYTGPLVPLIWRSIPDLGPSFTQFADGLKQRVEQRG